MILNYSVVVASRFLPCTYAGHEITLVGFVAIFMLFTRLINMQMNSLKMSVERKSTSLDDLEVFWRQVESLYETLRSFRHDYTNVMIFT